MVACRYGICVLMFHSIISYNLSFVRCAHLRDIEWNTQREIPCLRGPMYYSLSVIGAVEQTDEI